MFKILYSLATHRYASHLAEGALPRGEQRKAHARPQKKQRANITPYIKARASRAPTIWGGGALRAPPPHIVGSFIWCDVGALFFFVGARVLSSVRRGAARPQPSD